MTVGPTTMDEIKIVSVPKISILNFLARWLSNLLVQYYYSVSNYHPYSLPPVKKILSFNMIHN